MILSYYSNSLFRSHISGRWLKGLGYSGPYYLRKELIDSLYPDNGRIA